MGQTDLPRCGRDASRCSPSGTGLDVAIILKIEKKGRGGCVSGCFGAVRGGLRRQPSEMQKLPSAQTRVLRRRRTNK